jgi:hypothetical protein
MKAIRRRLYFFAVAAFTGVALLLFIFFRRSDALPVLTSNPDFGIQTTITVGTNHVYHYGDAIDHVFDPVITRLSDTNANRLRHETPQPSTMLWIRLKHPDFGTGPTALLATPTGPVRVSLGRIADFRAILKNAAGAETILERSPVSQHFKQKIIIGGYLLPGPLDLYHGGTLLLQSTNREDVATFRIP